MKYHRLLSLMAFWGISTALQENPQALRLLETLHGPANHSSQSFEHSYMPKRESAAPSKKASSRFLTKASSKYVVKGTRIPNVDFDIGESYAGLMPIDKKKTLQNTLYFWFFPVATKEFKEKKEIVIWLNGGPGCSSLLGLAQENGPFLWQPGMAKPRKNSWAFNLLTNVVWVEQPVTTGFSKGTVSISDEDELARQFNGFWNNFVDTFGMQDYDIYIAAESYGGMYGPYIARYFLEADIYDFKGLLIYDGLMFNRHIQSNVVAGSFMEMHRELFPFDDNTRQRLHDIADKCNFTSYEKDYLQYPPSGPAPSEPPGLDRPGPGGMWSSSRPCGNFFRTMVKEMTKLNPCLNIYNVLDKCPSPSDAIMASKSWFNRKDVKRAIHAPLDVEWKPCRPVVFKGEGDDNSRPSGEEVLPYVIEKTENVILAHGAMDFILPANGVLLGIQNMTWGGKMGFQTAPRDPFFVPSYETDSCDAGSSCSGDSYLYGTETPSGTGIVGTTHHERGLTFVVTQLAGHMGPGDSPAGAFRHLEKLTGRVDSLSSKAPFTLPEIRHIEQTASELAQGTVPIPCFGQGC